MLAQGYLLEEGGREIRWTNDTRSRFLATGDATGGAFCLVDETARRGEEVPLHRHGRDLEAIYVIAGALSLYLGGAPVRQAGPGAFAFIPAGAEHGFRVVSGTARYLLLTTPHHGDFYRAISRPASAGGARPVAGVDAEMIMAACAAHDVEFIAPLPPETGG